jgi:hypothetical protein
MNPRQRRWFLVLAGAGFGLLAAIGPVAANPLPDGAIFTHVQLRDPDFCATHEIATCEDIEQISIEAGLLTFGLFYQPIAPLTGPVAFMDFELRWQDSWVAHDLIICCGDFFFEQLEHGIQIEVLVDPEYQLDQFFLIGHVALEVTTAGRLEIPHALVGEGGYLFVDGIPGTAGVPCGDCAQPCDYSDACLARTDVDFLAMTVPQDGLAEAQFHGWAGGLNPLCDIAFYTPSPFLSLVVEEAPSGYDVTVVADGTGLEPGEHFGHVVAFTNMPCELCLPVYLTVTPTTPVAKETWGAIKSLYR